VKHKFITTEYCRENDLANFPTESRDVIVVSTAFNPAAKSEVQSPVNSGLSENSISLLDKAVRALKYGGLLFVYGLPSDLAFWGEHLSEFSDGTQQMIFKYWIALDIDEAPGNGLLKPTHFGLLMYLKSRANRKGTSSFHLNTDSVRILHAQCAACGQTLKDWGGKKHLMNPKGAALSDVWHDLPRRSIRDSIVPKDVLARIFDLTRVDGGSYLHVIQNQPRIERSADAIVRSFPTETRGRGVRAPLDEPNQVLETDCISFLEKVTASHPEGLFDLAFADPPYNLKKLYGSYEDALAEKHYIEWCNAWLEGMARTLKPGGSLFVLNLPKWAVHHAAFLNRHLEFRHWIVWDALSDPRGKLMPAHYALLYYTKPGGKPVFNYAPMIRRSGGSAERRHLNAKESAALFRDAATGAEDFVVPPDSPKYCLRASCVKGRKRRRDDAKVELSDIWFDIHRIKHKRDRDAHPCQLPEKLMDRVIRLTTQRGGLVFDPFCGAGTTAIAATKLGRHFVVTDVDPNYVRITHEKLAAMKENADLFGNFCVPRVAVVKKKLPASKRDVELCLQSLAQRLGRTPTEGDIASNYPNLLEKIDAIYPTRSAAIKRAKVALSV
jgi:DNA modification methylase